MRLFGRSKKTVEAREQEAPPSDDMDGQYDYHDYP